jgi:hypothetical protein
MMRRSERLFDVTDEDRALRGISRKGAGKGKTASLFLCRIHFVSAQFSGKVKGILNRLLEIGDSPLDLVAT